MKNAYANFGLSVFILSALAATSAGAADKFKVPRTSWGIRPSRHLTNNTDVPVERARNLGDKAFFTEQEYQASKKSGATAEEGGSVRIGATAPTAGDVHYDNSEFGLIPEQNQMVKNLRTSIITLPANGRLPPCAQTRRSAAVKTAPRRQGMNSTARRTAQFSNVASSGRMRARHAAGGLQHTCADHADQGSSDPHDRDDPRRTRHSHCEERPDFVV
jgi:hypothetical protein